MDLQEIRDKLIEQRTLYQNSVAESENACKTIEDKLAQLNNTETIQMLSSQGFDLEPILSCDIQEIKKSPEKVAAYSEKLDTLINKIYVYLKGELNV